MQKKNIYIYITLCTNNYPLPKFEQVSIKTYHFQNRNNSFVDLIPISVPLRLFSTHRFYNFLREKPDNIVSERWARCINEDRQHSTNSRQILPRGRFSLQHHTNFQWYFLESTQVRKPILRTNNDSTRKTTETKMNASKKVMKTWGVGRSHERAHYIIIEKIARLVGVRFANLTFCTRLWFWPDSRALHHFHFCKQK